MKLSQGKYLRALAATSIAGASLLTLAGTSGASSGGLAKGAPVNIGIS